MREDMALIERAKVELGSRAFAAQYQQMPLHEEDGMVRRVWFGRYGVAPVVFDRVVQSWDTAIKSGERHDATVCLTFGEAGGLSYLLDVRLVRYEYPDLKRLFVALAERWKPQAILVEDRASGQQLLQDMRREGHLPLIATQSVQDKVTRFAAVSAMIEAGRVVLPADAVWLGDFEGEVLGFPASGHDDQVDALTQYLDWVRRGVFGNMRVRRF
jgi:predicted phage terminase large subunit-like protein